MHQVSEPKYLDSLRYCCPSWGRLGLHWPVGPVRFLFQSAFLVLFVGMCYYYIFSHATHSFSTLISFYFYIWYMSYPIIIKITISSVGRRSGGSVSQSPGGVCQAVSQTIGPLQCLRQADHSIRCRWLRSLVHGIGGLSRKVRGAQNF